MLAHKHLRLMALVLTLMSFFVIVWIADRLNKPLPCFDSEYISSFHVQNETSVNEVPRCEIASLWQREGSVKNGQLLHLGNALSTLHVWTREFGGFLEPVRLRVNLVQTHQVRVNPVAVDLGVDLLDSHGPLLRAFLEVWMLQRMPRFAERAPLERDVWVDLALSYLQGGLRLQGRAPDQWASYDSHFWLHDLRSWRSLCQSAWQSGHTDEACAELAPTDEAQQAGHTFSPWSLRPLVGSLFWKTYQNLPLVVKARFFANWVRAQMEPKVEMTGDSRWRESVLDFEGRAHTSAIYRAAVTLAEQLGQTGNTSTDSFWRQSLNQVLSTADYTLTPGQMDANLYVRSQQTSFHKQDFADVYQVSLAEPERLLVIADHYDHYIFPNLEPVELILDSDGFFSRTIWEACGGFQIKSILTEIAPTRRILLVDRCTQVEPVHYQPLVAAGIESFAHHNPVTAFVEIQPDALSFAAELTHVDLARIEWKWVDQQHTVSKVEGLVGLYQPQWSEFGQAYRVNGTVEAINWYRAPNPDMRPELN